MFPDAGCGCGHHKAVFLHQILHLHQAVIKVAVAVNGGKDAGSLFTGDILRKIFPHQQRHDPSVDRRTDNDQLVRSKVQLAAAGVGQGEVVLLHRDVKRLCQRSADGTHRPLSSFGAAEINQRYLFEHKKFPLCHYYSIGGKQPQVRVQTVVCRRKSAHCQCIAEDDLAAVWIKFDAGNARAHHKIAGFCQQRKGDRVVHQHPFGIGILI